LPAAMQATERTICQSLSGQYAIQLFEEQRPAPFGFTRHNDPAF
jgi:hypothetical protein